MTRSFRYLVPLGAENKWSDLLATLIECDPESAAPLLGLDDSKGRVRVRREAIVNGRDRVDLILESEGVVRSVIEVKVLSGLGRQQLTRYRAAFPEAPHHIVVFPRALTIDIAREAGWRPVLWEQLLDAFSGSSDSWVAETARAWREQLAAEMPVVGPSTAWDDLQLGEDFPVALRARMAWVFGQVSPPPRIVPELVGSVSGVSWVLRMVGPASRPGYSVLAEAEEKLPNRNYPKTVSATSRRPRGPSVKVCLLQSDVTTSAGFDWDYLHRMWPLMEAARGDWVTNPPRLKAEHEKAAWRGIVDRGAPRFLGIGFGERQTQISRACMFGARFQLPPDVTLADIVATLHNAAELLLAMSRIQ